MSARWLGWLQAGSSSAVEELLPGRVIVSPGLRLTLGAGTNEDEILVIATSGGFVGLGPPSIRVFPEVGSQTLTVRVRAHAEVASMFVEPKSIARISGTGLVAPVL